jgi:hypothetical protein
VVGGLNKWRAGICQSGKKETGTNTKSLPEWLGYSAMRLVFTPCEGARNGRRVSLGFYDLVIEGEASKGGNIKNAFGSWGGDNMCPPDCEEN